MRFFVIGEFGFAEVIGELVDLGKPEQYAVHNNIFNDALNGRDALFVISHVDSGFRVSVGDTVDFAIENAKQRIAMLTDQQYREGIATAFKIKAERFAA